MIIRNKELISGLEQILGLKPALEPIDPDEIKGVALYLRHGFLFNRANIAEREVVFVEPIGNIDLNPGRVQGYFTALNHALNVPIVLVLDTIETYNRKGYAERRIPFIVPGEQLFIPSLLIDLKTKSLTHQKAREHFRPATQSMLLHHLWMLSLNGLDQRSIAPVIQYSEMTVSRAVKELEKTGLVTKDKYGLHFLEDRKLLWEKALGKLQSPVKQTVFASKVMHLNSAFVKSGFTALSYYTPLANLASTTYAIASEAYTTLREKHLHEVSHRSGEMQIELWTYPPYSLQKNGVIDPFSLYLSLRDDNTDERVSIALDELLNKFL